MYIDTGGNLISEMGSICDCGLTGGCYKCNPNINISIYLNSYEDNILDRYLRKTSNNTVSIEEIRKITDKLPKGYLTNLLKD